MQKGSLVTPEKLPFGKGYSIVEVQAPYGYVLDETPVYFDVTEDNSTEESGVTVVKVDKPNMAQKGTITVEKTGEVFFGVSVIGGVDESGNELPTIYQPQYESVDFPVQCMRSSPQRILSRRTALSEMRRVGSWTPLQPMQPAQP